jgi:hypothetical protein
MDLLLQKLTHKAPPAQPKDTASGYMDSHDDTLWYYINWMQILRTLANVL